MIRTQIRLTEKQYSTMRIVAAREGISMSEVVRRALDMVLEPEPLPDRDEVRRRAMAAIGSYHADVSDLSTSHDDYLAEIYSE